MRGRDTVTGRFVSRPPIRMGHTSNMVALMSGEPMTTSPIVNHVSFGKIAKPIVTWMPTRASAGTDQGIDALRLALVSAAVLAATVGGLWVGGAIGLGPS
jgi:hypothetical protein